MRYLIKKGHHFARFTSGRLWPFSSRCIIGTIRFDKSCWHSRESIEFTGWNKLTGISSWRIHRNSGRLVWQPDFDRPGRILIAAYLYIDGKRIVHQFSHCEVGEAVPYSIFDSGRNWSFSTGIDTIHLDLQSSFKLAFKCFPYFGGKSTAPGDMVIEVVRERCFD